MKKNEIEQAVAAGLVNDVKQLLADIDATHRYSISRIYGLYNRATGRDETPQSCASCLIRKTKELRAWIALQEQDANNRSPVINTGTPTRKRMAMRAGKKK